MKLLEQNVRDWPNVAPYLDTICLPVFRYQFKQKVLQLEEAHLIEYITEELEKRLMGRMLLLPAISFFGSDNQLLTSTLASFSEEVVYSGFHYVFLVIIEEDWKFKKEDASLYVLKISKDVDKEAELERVYGQILSVWQSG